LQPIAFAVSCLPEVGEGGNYYLKLCHVFNQGLTMQRNLLLSLLIWLLEIILVASFVSDRWTRDIESAEDQMLIA